MFGDQFVVCDVDQEVLLKEALNPCLVGHSRDDLEGSRSNVDVGNENSSVEAVLGEMLGKVAHLLDADVGLRQELDPNCTNVGWVWDWL